MTSSVSRRVKVVGSGRGARLSVLYIGAVPFFCLAVGVWQGILEFLPILAVILAAALRSVFMGAYFLDGRLVVVSWFRTWRFDTAEVKRVVWRRYRGLLNRYLDDDSRLTWIWMVGLSLEGNRRTRFFPSIVGSRTGVERVAASLAASLGVRAVRM